MSIRWRRLPIRLKLILLCMLISFTGLVIAGVTVVVNQTDRYKSELVAEQSIYARVIAEQSVAALLFEDFEQLEELLRSLRLAPAIRSACVYRHPEDILVATQIFANTGPCPEQISQVRPGYSGNALTVIEPLVSDGETVGYVLIDSGLDELKRNIQEIALLTLTAGVIAFLLVLVIVERLQRVISRPLLELAVLASGIARDHDYSRRTKTANEDEIGLLASAFNEMLETIEAQNRKIRLHSRDLERQVEKRTEELIEANKDLESFSYSVSHDLRQPLRAIDGFSEAIAEDYGDKLDDTGKDYIRRVRAATSRMGELIDAMLQLSRVRRSTFQPETINVTELFQEISDEYLRVDGEATNTVTIMPGIHVEGDATLLRIAMANLFDNAWKYSSRQAERRINISARYSEKEITLLVEDNGEGFDMKYANKLFTAFNRLHSPKDFPGNGVGLATVQRVIQRHGGKITVKSEPGHGTSFRLHLPKSKNAN